MHPTRVLIVDDEPSIRFVMERTLKREGFEVETASSGNEAIEMVTAEGYDLLLLDLHMEPVSGLQVLEAVKQSDPSIIVIILTAHSSVESAVEALRLGAFDYLFKPSTPDAIRHRVREGLVYRQTDLRRQRLISQIGSLREMLDELDANSDIQASPSVEHRFLHSGNLIIDRNHRVATWDDKLLDLTTTEFDILVCLVDDAPEPISPSRLVQQALGYESEDSEARGIVKWHIHQLRSKIEPDRKKPRYIVTVRYKGYLWRNE